MHRRTWLRLVPPKSTAFPHQPHPVAPELARVGQWFHAMSDTTRLYILQLLAQRDRSAGELHEILFAPRSRISFHLKVLSESELITAYRVGQQRFYSPRGETLEFVLRFARTVLPGAHVGTCPWTCCQTRVLTYQEKLIRSGP